MVAALIFLFSFDGKHSEQFGKVNQNIEQYPSPIGLYQFLQSLFGEEFI